MTENAVESLRKRMRRIWIAIGLLFVMNAALSLMLANLVAEDLDIFINFFNVLFVPVGVLLVETILVFGLIILILSLGWKGSVV